MSWKRRVGAPLLAALVTIACSKFCLAAAKPGRNVPPLRRQYDRPNLTAIRLAVDDLVERFGPEYPKGTEYRARLATLQTTRKSRDPRQEARLQQLRRDALLDNPLLDFDRLIVLKRRREQLGLPTNHQCNSCLPQQGYDNEIAILAPARPEGKLTTLFRPPEGFFVGEIDLHFDGDRLLFTMPNGRTWQIHEIQVDGTGRRQVSREVPDVDNFDACYLPDGRIVFASTASFTGVPCWHGRERACCLYLMNTDGSGVRQLCFDQDHDLHPSVLADGQVVFSRWDYTGIMHMYLRPLMAMNPDGSLQRAIYGTNSFYPNSLYFPRAIPGAPTRLAAILSGYHGPHRMGELVILDIARGWHGADGIVHRIAHRGELPVPVIRDNLVGSQWPKFLHPYPLSEKYLLTAAQNHKGAPWGIYLVDVFDNMLPLLVDPQYDFFEPIPVRKTPKPPAIADRIDLRRHDATVYLQNVYAGPGLKGVPRGAVKRLRIVAYHYGYPGMAGSNKIGRAGPWEAMRILGTVPVDRDGSVCFRVPASTPISVQPLDAQGKALALMRSWYSAMPGESVSCIGCHEASNDTPLVEQRLAERRLPVDIEPWHGPARGFDFEREVQPVLDKYCVGCHNGQLHEDGRRLADLRAEHYATGYEGLPLSYLGGPRLEPELRDRREKFAPYEPMHKLLGDRKMLYTPAYEALVPFIRRVNVEDYVGLHAAAEYHADTSELVQMLQKGHYNVALDEEAWDRLVTWIDLNGPCHGTWGDIAPIPHGADRRRRELAERFGGPKEDPEQIPALPRWSGKPILPAPPPKRKRPRLSIAGWPFDRTEARRRQRASAPWQKTIDLGDGIELNLVRIPAGDFVMGSVDGEIDEYPPSRVTIADDFWMSTVEITNEQFRQFDAEHCSGYFVKRSLSRDGPGITMNDASQPVVRVSWDRALAYCRWLSERTGVDFTLPTEAQWEYACRAGSDDAMSYGSVDADFSAHANMADAAIDRLYTVTGGVVVLQDIPSDTRFDDHGIATVDVASYQPNAWGLYDLHGNAAEWTLSSYRPYPYCSDDSRNAANPDDRKVVRGGSFYDRPKRCRSTFRLSYPAWRCVHNVGFRVVSKANAAGD